MDLAVTALIFGQAVHFASWGVALNGVVIAPPPARSCAYMTSRPCAGLWRGIRRLLRGDPPLDRPFQALACRQRISSVSTHLRPTASLPGIEARLHTTPEMVQRKRAVVRRPTAAGLTHR
jgi:hypothetical protein